MRKSLLPLLFLLPMAAFAAEPQCKHTEARDLQLDLAGVKAVVFEVGSHDLKLDASAGASAALHGQACASEEEFLPQLTLTQRKNGDKLHVTLKREGNFNLLFNNYAYLKIAGTLPDNITVQLDVGSGDAKVTGASVLSADVGSGDVEAKRIKGLVAAKVNSGDIQLEDIGSLQVISVGSGDLSAKRVKGAVKVGSVGSGDFELEGAMGDVEIGSVGSGDAKISGISGNVSVDSLGSGDIDARDIRGDFTVRTIGSGSANHSKVDGRISVPSQD